MKTKKRIKVDEKSRRLEKAVLKIQSEYMEGPYTHLQTEQGLINAKKKWMAEIQAANKAWSDRVFAADDIFRKETEDKNDIL